MKQSKPPQKLAANASKLHKRIGTLLQNMPIFIGCEIRQEYRVSDVNDKFPSNKEKFDWVILGVNIVIECHGKQHYEPTRFGGVKDDVKTTRNFMKLQDRDLAKKAAAEEAGWAYVVVNYDELDITEEELHRRITQACIELSMSNTKPKLEELLNKGRKNKDSQIQKIKNKSNWPRGQKIPSKKFNSSKKTLEDN